MKIEDITTETLRTNWKNMGVIYGGEKVALNTKYSYCWGRKNGGLAFETATEDDNKRELHFLNVENGVLTMKVGPNFEPIGELSVY